MIDSTKPNFFVRLANDFRFQIATLMAFALLLNREGDRVPSGNEFVYLLYLYKGWHPSFLATDWTFQEPTAGHAIFNYAAGWLTRLMPLEIAAWVGRLLCWFGAFAGLLRVGRHFKIPPWAVWIGIVLWLIEGQSLVTEEWMVGTFEAKCIAYICLLFAIDAVLTGKLLRAGVLCGVTFSFHSAVGMWAGMALGVVVLTHYSIRQTIGFCVAVIVFSLPGLITSLPLITGPHSISASEAEFLTTKALPDDFDTMIFPMRWMIAMGVMAVFAPVCAGLRWKEREFRMLVVFETTIAVFFFLGVLARLCNQFNLVELFPLRVFAVFAMLFFFWQWAMSIQREPTAKVMITAVVVVLLILPNPAVRLWQMISSHIPGLHQSALGQPDGDRSDDDTDFQAGAKWIAHHAGLTDVVIAPPWHNDGFYCIRRPLIANWHAPRYDAITEWKARLESLVGDVSHLNLRDPDNTEMDSSARAHYAHLSTQDIDQIRQHYGGNWLLTIGKYPYDQAFYAGNYVVYRLH